MAPPNQDAGDETPPVPPALDALRARVSAAEARAKGRTMAEQGAELLRRFAEDADKETLSLVDRIGLRTFTAYMHMFKHDVPFEELCDRLEEFGFTHEKAMEHVRYYLEGRMLLHIYDEGRAARASVLRPS